MSGDTWPSIVICGTGFGQVPCRDGVPSVSRRFAAWPGGLLRLERTWGVRICQWQCDETVGGGSGGPMFAERLEGLHKFRDGPLLGDARVGSEGP